MRTPVARGRIAGSKAPSGPMRITAHGSHPRAGQDPALVLGPSTHGRVPDPRGVEGRRPVADDSGFRTSMPRAAVRDEGCGRLARGGARTGKVEAPPQTPPKAAPLERIPQGRPVQGRAAVPLEDRVGPRTGAMALARFAHSGDRGAPAALADAEPRLVGGPSFAGVRLGHRQAFLQQPPGAARCLRSRRAAARRLGRPRWRHHGTRVRPAGRHAWPAVRPGRRDGRVGQPWADSTGSRGRASPRDGA